MLLTDKYADKIYGTITCYDRMIIQGYIPGWSHAEGMTGYLNANNIRIFDFSNFSQPLTEQIRANAQRIADENGIEIEFIPFDDHCGGKENLTKVTDSVVDKGRSYRGLNFFAERDLHVLEVISRGGYMTFGMQGKDIRQPCPGYLNVSVSMGSLKGCRALTNISPQPMAKKSLPQDLPSKTLCLYQHWHRYFSYAKNFAILQVPDNPGNNTGFPCRSAGYNPQLTAYAAQHLSGQLSQVLLSYARPWIYR
ncbi:hypothetical protein C804_05552 [Lachnospiraceae bacterium A4]|nr:hypothetical protein C804_05552 [Lachnospiraceae bacterium A4]